MRCSAAIVIAAVLVHSAISLVSADESDKKHHHHKHHKHHHKHGHRANSTAAAKFNSTAATEAMTEATVLTKMKSLEQELSEKVVSAPVAVKQGPVMQKGRLHVNGPLPFNFATVFSEAISEATGCVASEVIIVDMAPATEDPSNPDRIVDFQAPKAIIEEVEDQAADPLSKLAAGEMRPYLVQTGEPSPISAVVSRNGAASGSGADADADADANYDDAAAPAAVASTGIDIDTAMPYGELEPFGREDTAQELTEQSIGESDEMVDQLERAEVAEEKRSVFRALTRLRGAAITSFDGIARSQTGNIDEYNKVHQWRTTHPLRHLADEESDVAKWAFPDDADF